jgi:hypothetical protein
MDAHASPISLGCHRGRLLIPFREKPGQTMTTPASESTPEGRSTLGRLGWWPLVVAVVVAVIVVVYAIGTLQPRPGPLAASVGVIIDRPAAFLDREVIVSGRVETLLTERAVTIGSDLIDGSLLVVLRDELTDPAAAAVGVPARVGQTFFEGDVVQISGDLRPFRIATFEQDYGVVLNPDLFGPFVDQPALVAREVSLTTLGVAPVQAPEPVALASVVAEPDRWAGRSVLVEGHVGRRIADAAFVLGGPAAGDVEGIIVVGPPPALGVLDELDPGAAVEVEGTVWEFDRDLIEAETGLALDAALYTEFEGRPAMLADDVRVRDG